MPVFEYKGLNKTGKNVRGNIDADNVRTAKARLKKDGIFVVELKDKTRIEKRGKAKKSIASRAVSVQDLSLFTRQLASLLKAQVPLVDSLQAVSEQIENEMLSNVVADIKNSVNEGGAFNKALAKYPKIFDKIFISMCEAGETSGTLELILMRLAEFTEAQAELQAKVKSALMYPVLMIVFSILLLAGLFIYVVPKIVMVFESTPELKLPWYTIMVIDISGFLVNYWHIIGITIFLSYVIFRNWKSSENGRKQWDAMSLNFPVVGKINRIVAVSRFTRTLATLLTGGVPMLTAMGIVRNVVGNETIAKAIDGARDNISEGESIAGPLKKSGQFPPIVIHMINIGEKTGELERMLIQVSDSYDFQVKNSVDGMTSLLTPVMIIMMGGVIGVIVFAIMVPMFEMSNMAG